MRLGGGLSQSLLSLGCRRVFGLTDEYSGQLPADNIVNIAMSAFGQGISVTQTQMLLRLQPLPTMGLC